jgi:DNA-binding transcriptional MocR family regulator
MPSTKSPINLLRGWPSPSLHPTSALLSASQYALTHPAISTPGLQYGPDEGYTPLRYVLSTWLSSFYSVPDDPARLCISGGASQNMACALQVFSDPNITKRIWMVTPCYYLACGIFEDAGFTGRLRAVREDEEGIDIEFLERELEKLEHEEPRGPVSTFPFSLFTSLLNLSLAFDAPMSVDCYIT